MKLNWGNMLVLVFIAFGSMIGYLVYRCSKTNYDLVSKDYYNDELKYQETIDGTKRAGLLAGVVSVRQENDSIAIRFPGGLKNPEITGDAWFYCASDARRDKKIVLRPGSEAVQQVSRRQFIPGNYIVKISWNNDHHFYYSEQAITIP